MITQLDSEDFVMCEVGVMSVIRELKRRSHFLLLIASPLAVRLGVLSMELPDHCRAFVLSSVMDECTRAEASITLSSTPTIV
jgi:hypothetical protein